MTSFIEGKKKLSKPTWLYDLWLQEHAKRHFGSFTLLWRDFDLLFFAEPVLIQPHWWGLCMANLFKAMPQHKTLFLFWLSHSEVDFLVCFRSSSCWCVDILLQDFLVKSRFHSSIVQVQARPGCSLEGPPLSQVFSICGLWLSPGFGGVPKP